MQVTKADMPETSECLTELPRLPWTVQSSAGAPRAGSAAAPQHSSGQPWCPSLHPADQLPCTAVPARLLCPLCPVQLLQGPQERRDPLPTALTVTGSCRSEELRDSLMEQWMTLSETIWISHEIRPIFTWYSLLSRPRLSGSF